MLSIYFSLKIIIVILSCYLKLLLIVYLSLNLSIKHFQKVVKLETLILRKAIILIANIMYDNALVMSWIFNFAAIVSDYTLVVCS